MTGIAIITARGGSKRIPKKNIMEFCGKPLIAYSIEAARASGVFDEVMVSTDSEEIAEIARRYGAEVPFMRSKETANDYATTNDVLLEVLSRYKDMGREFEVAGCIYPTAPFVTGEKLSMAYNKLLSSDADTLISVVKFSYPPQRSYVKCGEYISFAHPEYALSRSQDLEEQYHDAGQFYIFKTDSFIKERSLLKGKIIPYELPELEVQDIDTMTDFRLAELKYRAMKEKAI